MITVALPIYNSQKIAWLCLESLCRQKTNDNWELIIAEELFNNIGRKYIMSYADRLEKAGCVNIKYIEVLHKITLTEKWYLLFHNAAKNSKMICLCAADNYYSRDMIQRSAMAYCDDIDWLYSDIGYFYDFISDITVRYMKVDIVGLQMSLNTKLALKIPNFKKNSIIDRWLYKMADPKRKLSYHSEYTLCTHGFNNISVNRGKFFNPVKEPFYSTSKTYKDIVPDSIANRINELKHETSFNN